MPYPHTNGHSRPQSFADLFPSRSPAPSEAQIHALNDLVSNIAFTRERFAQRLVDPRTDLNKECGYPDIISPELYEQTYRRNSTARRYVNFMVEEAWQTPAELYEDEDPSTDTPFEKRLNDVNRGLRGTRNWRKAKDGDALNWYMKDVNRLSRISSYGVLLIGLDDKLPLSQPAAGVEEANSGVSVVGNDGSVRPYALTVNAKKTANRQLLYLRALSEYYAPVLRWETNESSPRYGQPISYQVTLNDPTLYQSSSGNAAPPSTTMEVHWTRVVHTAEGDVRHDPPMEAVFNHLKDLAFTYGAAGRAFWLNALAKLIFSTPPGVGGDLDFDLPRFKDTMEEYTTGLQPWMVAMGLQPRMLAPAVIDPNPHIDAVIKAVCIVGGYPKRIFEGSERGELASSSDEDAWDGRVGEYRTNHVGPRIVAETVNRLIMLGVLPEPADGYYLRWPHEEVLTKVEQSQVCLTRTQAAAAYEAGMRPLMARMDYLTREMAYTEDEARVILENAQKEQEEEQQKLADQQAQQAAAMAEAQLAGPGSPPGPFDGGQPPPGGGSPPDAPKPPGGPPMFVPAPSVNAAGSDDSDSDPHEAAELISEVLYGLFGEDALTFMGGATDGEADATTNVFCPTGEGGGVDPSCSSGGGPGSEAHRRSIDEYGPMQEAASDNRIHGATVHTMQRPDAPSFHDPHRLAVEGDVAAVVGRGGPLKAPVRTYFNGRGLSHTIFWVSGERAATVTTEPDGTVEVERQGRASRVVPADLPEAERRAAVDRALGFDREGAERRRRERLEQKAKEDEAYREHRRRWAEVANASRWNPLHHPRGEGGRFIPKGSAEAVTAAKEAIGRAIAGEHSSQVAEDVAAHLRILTVKQLKEVHKEHGVKPPEGLRDKLFGAVLMRIYEGMEADKAARGKKPGEAKAKEPTKQLYEMTRAEYAAAGHGTGRGFSKGNYEAEIEMAIEDGKPVPRHIAKEFDAVAAEHQPHLLTAEEFRHATGRGTTTGPAGPRAVGEANKEHRAAVSAALAAGKPVSAEVLKDYPELAGAKKESPASVDKKAADLVREGQGVGGGGTTQKRAQSGGETGPNGEWYPGGAFIATTDMPKKQKEKVQKYAAKGREQVDWGSAKDWEEAIPGKMPIFQLLGAGSSYDPRKGELNEAYLDYEKATPERRARLHELLARFKAGERFVDLKDYPDMARIKDVARAVVAGLAVPGDALKRMPADLRAVFEKYKPDVAGAKKDTPKGDGGFLDMLTGQGSDEDKALVARVEAEVQAEHKALQGKVKDAQSRVDKIKGEMADWSGRQYKQSGKKIEVGRDEMGSAEMSVGHVNELRRARRLKHLSDELSRAESDLKDALRKLEQAAKPTANASPSLLSRIKSALGLGPRPAGTPHSDVANAEGDDPSADANPDEQAELIAEILYGLFGDDALPLFAPDATPTANAARKWDPLVHPRGEGGRFIPRGSAEAVATARDAISRVLKGEKTAHTAEQVAQHLSILTVKQLRELHAEHGQKPSGRLREQLVAAVKERLPEGGGAGKTSTPDTAAVDPAAVAKAYGDGIPAMPLGKAPFRAVTDEDHQLLRAMDFIVPSSMRAAWDAHPPRHIFEADKSAVEALGKANLQKLLDRGYLEHRVIPHTWTNAPTDYYFVTKAGNSMQALRIEGHDGVPIPKTREQADDVADLLGDNPGLRDQFFKHVGFEGQTPTDRRGVRTTLQEMLYRAYNPVPVADRIRQNAALQEKVKAIVDDNDKAFDALQKLLPIKREIKNRESELGLYSDNLKKLTEDVAWAKTAGDEKAARRWQKQVDSASKQINDVTEKLADLHKQRDAIMKERAGNNLDRILAVPDPAPVAVSSFDPAHSHKDKDAVEEARQWLEGKVQKGAGGETLPAYAVIKDESNLHGRGHPSAYYRSSDNAINVHAGMTSAATNVHEMGHGVEYKIPGVQSAAQKFLAYRVKDEPLRKLKEVLPDAGYADWEEGRKDDFEKALGKYGAWYAGKKALADGATEIVSMGLEHLYRDPANFARKDPEFTGFILGVLDGSIRDRPVPSGHGMATNRWVTLGEDSNNPGQRVWVDDGGGIRPGGPDDEVKKTKKSPQLPIDNPEGKGHNTSSDQSVTKGDTPMTAKVPQGTIDHIAKDMEKYTWGVFAKKAAGAWVNDDAVLDAMDAGGVGDGWVQDILQDPTDHERWRLLLDRAEEAGVDGSLLAVTRKGVDYFHPAGGWKSHADPATGLTFTADTDGRVRVSGNTFAHKESLRKAGLVYDKGSWVGFQKDLAAKYPGGSEIVAKIG